MRTRTPSALLGLLIAAAVANVTGTLKSCDDDGAIIELSRVGAAAPGRPAAEAAAATRELPAGTVVSLP